MVKSGVADIAGQAIMPLGDFQEEKWATMDEARRFGNSSAFLQHPEEPDKHLHPFKTNCCARHNDDNSPQRRYDTNRPYPFVGLPSFLLLSFSNKTSTKEESCEGGRRKRRPRSTLPYSSFYNWCWLPWDHRLRTWTWHSNKIQWADNFLYSIVTRSTTLPSGLLGPDR